MHGDGTITHPFNIQPGQLLVVTSFDWMANGFWGASANSPRTAWLFRYSADSVNGPSAMVSGMADAREKAGAQATFPSGIVLRNPLKFCMQMDDLARDEKELAYGTLNGFIAADK